MPAYVIAEIDLHDPAPYEEYKKKAPGTIAAHGGRYLVRGGDPQLLDGEGAPPRMVVLEFPDRAAAQAWWDSEEYRRIRGIREAATRSRIVLVEGLPG